MNIRRCVFLSLLLPALSLLGLASTARGEIVERVAAVINNDVITLSELDDTVNQVQGQELEAIVDPVARAAKRQEIRKVVLEQMIDQRLMTQLYDKLHIQATDQDIEDMVAAVVKQNGITEEALKAELDRQGLSYAEYRNQVRQHILQSRFIDQVIRARVTVSEEDVKRRYTTMVGTLGAEDAYDLTGVVVLVPRGGGPSAMDNARRQAQSAKDQLAKGTAADAVAQAVTDGSVQSLGEMGALRKSEMLEALRDVVLTLKAGEVAAPIETAQGFYVIKLKAITRLASSDVKPYEDVRPQVYRQLYEEQVEQQLTAYLKNARKEAHVELLLR